MQVPTSTYRLQFRNGMTFADACSIIPYLKRIGVSHLYASPLFMATEGSTHGYDIVDPNQIDPAIGGPGGFERLVAALKAAEMQLILDIVPNHMAASLENPWWRSLLKLGPDSPYATYFDVDWTGPITLPVLDDPFPQALASGSIGLSGQSATGKAGLTHGTLSYPLRPESAARIMALVSSRRACLDELAADHAFIEALHREQHWHFIPWKDARRCLSYRRFFEVAGLVGLRIEDQDVFNETHRLIIELVHSGQVQGFRVDHVDGLSDPADYLAKLLKAVGPSAYIIVEKILAQNETMPPAWPVAGTTGYEVIASFAELFVEREGLELLDKAYRAVAPTRADFDLGRREAKRAMVERNFAGERARLTDLAMTVAPQLQRATADEAIAGILVAFPVYRTYGATGSLEGPDRVLFENVLADAAWKAEEPEAVWVIGRAILDPDDNANALELRRRLQQLSGPVMAKAMEDTLFYRYNRLLGLNEVGGDPATLGSEPDDFHRTMCERAILQQGLSATSTHDTKRGEDARARLYALTEHAAEWLAGFDRWQQLNRAFIVDTADGPWPEPNTQWMLYQALAGIWPEDIEDIDGVLSDRFKNYAQKAIREAKTYTDWGEPNERYETAVLDFAGALLCEENQAFRNDFDRAIRRIIAAGQLNSLAQTLLKLTIPGVPDIYQGSEGPELSLVDPDNRRPVDFRRLEVMLSSKAADGGDVWQRKQTLIATGLKLRHARPELYDRGDYLPLNVRGQRHRHIVAFARHDQRQFSITIVPRLISRHIDAITLRTKPGYWSDTRIELPAQLNTPRQDILADSAVDSGPAIDIETAFRTQPFALLISVD